MMTTKRNFILGLLGSSALAGCGTLPTAGPTAGDVIGEIKDDNSGTHDPRYAVVDISDQVIQILRGRPSDVSLSSFGDYRSSIENVVGVGDTITLTIWEAGAGGLFSAPVIAGQISAGSRAATIPEQIIGRDGLISVPYAGRVRAAGRSTAEIQRTIERALQGKAIQPQVLVSVSKPVSNTVTVIGEGAAGARIPISPKGDRVLDVLASAGGLRAPVNESFVQLTRGSRTVRVAMARIASDPRENISVRPGDVLTIIKEPQMFMVYGAAGRNADIPFDTEVVTLAQALTKAGGLLDYRADPMGVFVFRMEPERLARSFPGAGPQATIGGYTKVVYRLNMRDANSMFLAGHFRIFHRDLIYISNAFLSDAQKFMQLFNLMSTPVLQGATAAKVF